jgi:hypothetical protein
LRRQRRAHLLGVLDSSRFPNTGETGLALKSDLRRGVDFSLAAATGAL